MSFYVVAHVVIGMADHEMIAAEPPRLAEISTELRAFANANDAPYMEGWPLGEGPKEWLDLQEEWDREYHAFVAQVMRREGEEEMAAFYLNHRQQFDEQVEKGRLAIFGPPPET